MSTTSPSPLDAPPAPSPSGIADPKGPHLPVPVATGGVFRNLRELLDMIKFEQ